MAEKRELLYLMQLAGGTFPSGGFSQSWGLETCVAEGKVKDSRGFQAFLKTYLFSAISSCEGPILCEAVRLAKDWDTEKIAELEELSRAVKVTKESRESSLRMGKAFLRVMADILKDTKISRLRTLYGPKGMTYPVIYGLVCGRLRLETEAVAQAFVFSTVNALVQSAVKLIPLGNTQAQEILTRMQPEMLLCSEISMKKPLEEISNFCPGLDIASIKHESLPVRLYMS